MGKRLNGPMGPIKGGRGLPLGLGAKGGAHPPLWPAHPPPLGSLVPHGGGEEDGTPLGLYKEGYTPFFQHTIIPLSLLLLPGSGLPLFGVCTWTRVLHHKAGRRSAGVVIQTVFLPLLVWFGAREEHRLY